MPAFSLNEILAALEELPPGQNPFLYLIKSIKSLRESPLIWYLNSDTDLQLENEEWQASLTVIVCICSTIWFGSLAINVVLLRTRWKHKDIILVHKQLTRRGTIYIPQLSVAWPVLQITAFCAAQVWIVCEFARTSLFSIDTI